MPFTYFTYMIFTCIISFSLLKGNFKITVRDDDPEAHDVQIRQIMQLIRVREKIWTKISLPLSLTS